VRKVDYGEERVRSRERSRRKEEEMSFQQLQKRRMKRNECFGL
jgi:hypothetical protein